jgi:hypothetical protein
LELGVVVGSVFYFGWAVEGKSGRHKNEHIPLALQGFVRDGHELAIVKGFVLECLDFGIDEGHEKSPFGLMKKLRRSI